MSLGFSESNHEIFLKSFGFTHLEDVNVGPSQTSGTSQSSPDGLRVEPLEVEQEQKAAEARGRKMHLWSNFVS